jgi:hemoglobin/transferrin/lactoferrin receptor protein
MMFLTKKNKIKLLCFFLVCYQSYGQKVYVEDKNTGEAIENVAIYSSDKLNSTITNSLGEASIDDFTKSVPIIFQINGYDDLKITLNNFKEVIYIQMIPKIENLDGIVLSVARSKTTKNKIAEKVNIITAQQIKKNIIQTGAEILEISPGVRVQKSQGGGGSPVLRGFEANRVLLVIDGIRMNNAIYRSGHLQNAITISPHILDRVEVTFGSSSVGYGSDALGGVIHYYTKTPDINSDIKNKNEFHSDFNYANMSTVNNITSNWSFKNWGSLTSISFSSFGDIKMGSKNSHGYKGWGLTNFYSENTDSFYRSTPTINPNPLIQKNTGYDQFDLFQKFRFKLFDQNYLSVNFQLSNSSNINRYDKLNEIRDGNLRYAQWYYGPQKRFLFSPKFEFFNGTPLLKSGIITLAFQDVKESRIDRKFGNLNKNHQFEKVSIFSLNADFSAKPTNKITASYGIEIIQNKIKSDAYSAELNVSGNQIINYLNKTAIPTRYPSNGSYYKSSAGYINLIWSINEFFSVNFGSRITYTDLGGSWKEEALINSLLSEVSINNWAMTNTIAAIYNPIKKIQLNFVLSSGFRNPNIDDIGKIRESGGFLIVPNPFLKPEYAYNLDTGISYESDNGLYSFSMRGFGSLISRHIVRSEYIIFTDQSTENPNTILFNGEEISTLANKNLGNRYVYGGSFESSIKLSDKLYTKASLTYTRGNKSFKNGPMPSIPPFFGNYSINYNNSRLSAQLMWNFSNAKNPNDYSYGGEDGLDETPLILNDQFAGTPAWEIFSIMTNYRYNNSTLIKLGLNNIFDTHYRTFASGISQPGRSIQLGISIDF